MNKQRQLQAKLDRLSSLWIEAEKRMEEIKPPVPVFGSIGDTEYLRWERHDGGDWKILFATPSECKPIVQCNAQIKIRAVKGLPGLLKNAKSLCEAISAQADAAIKELNQALYPVEIIRDETEPT